MRKAAGPSNEQQHKATGQLSLSRIGTGNRICQALHVPLDICHDKQMCVEHSEAVTIQVPQTVWQGSPQRGNKDTFSFTSSTGWSFSPP